MAEEAKDKNKSQQENKSQNMDNRLPYELPKLQKHGKVSNVTRTILSPVPQFDFVYGPAWLDLS